MSHLILQRGVSQRVALRNAPLPQSLGRTRAIVRTRSLRACLSRALKVVECGRRPYKAPPPKRRSSGPRRDQPGRTAREALGIQINDEIRFPSVRLLDSEKEMLGVYDIEEAIRMASMRQVDLVLLNPSADPPLCRLIEWGKYKFEIEKRQRQARQKQRAARVSQKELKMRPATDTHDYQVRLRKAIEEISRGNHVKLIVQYRGREIQNKEEGEDLMERFVEDLGDCAMIEKKASMEGRNLTLVLAPNKG